MQCSREVSQGAGTPPPGWEEVAELEAAAVAATAATEVEGYVAPETLLGRTPRGTEDGHMSCEPRPPPNPSR